MSTQKAKIELFCVAHKTPPLSLPKGTKVVGVADYKGGHFADNEGLLQISDKNPRMCELTAIYWLLNNYSFKGTHVGLCHYRRLWSDDAVLPQAAKYGDEYICQTSRWECQSFVSSVSALSDQMKHDKADILLPNSVVLGDSVAQHYQQTHDIDDLFLAFNVAIAKGYLSQAFARYFLEQNEMFPYNMAVLPTEYFVDTWTKICDVILAIEDKIPEKQEVYQQRALPMLRTAAYQNRVFGFLAERLLAAIVMHDLWKVQPKLRATSRAVAMIVD
jgi:hypothetical protein